jgi:hypothetical protein
MIGVGTLLLLPGICAVIVFQGDLKRILSDSTAVTYLSLTLGGIALIWAAVKRPSR